MSKALYFTGTSTRSSAGLASSAHTRARPAASAAGGQQVVERQPGVHDVLDQEHVAPLDLAVEVLEQPHHPEVSVADPYDEVGDEVDLVRDRERPRQVGRHEHHGPFSTPTSSRSRPW